MWNIKSSNRILNYYFKTREQNQHLERLITIRPVIDKSSPYKPIFLDKRLTKKELEVEKQKEIDDINNLIRQNIAETFTKPSKYNSQLLSPKKYSAFQKDVHVYSKTKKKKDIKKSNDKLKERINNIKGYYSTKKLLKQAREEDEYKMRICKMKSVIDNPHLLFKTPDEFRRLEELQLENELVMEQMRRPKTAKSVREEERKGNATGKETNVATCSSADKQTNAQTVSKRGATIPTTASINTNVAQSSTEK